MRRVFKYSAIIIAVILSSAVLIGGFKYFSRYMPSIQQNLRVKGPDAAPIDIVAFVDLQCPNCAAGMGTLDKFMSEHPGIVRLEVRDFPLEKANSNSLFAARYAECATKQGKFWEFQKVLFEWQHLWAGLKDPTSLFTIIAKKVRLDIEELDSCLQDEGIEKLILSRKEKWKAMGVEFVPTFLVNDELILGPKNLSARLEELSKDIIAPDGKVAIEIDFFYSEGCHECEEVKQGALTDVLGKYAGLITINEYETSDKDNYIRLIELEEKYAAGKNEPVAIFVGDTYLSGLDDIEENLPSAVEALIKSGAERGKKAMGSAPRDDNKIVERFKGFSVATVMAAGLADGVNPCAFATIVFLISFLTFAKRTRRDILLISISFGLAVFLTYTLLGLGIFKVFTATGLHRMFSKALYYAAGGIVLVLGFLSLRDAILYLKSGSAKDITLKLPDKLRDRIHSVIRNKLKTRGLVMSAFTVGFMVSILESVCTGQVYLPTIVFITKEPSLRAQAYFYLILYNLMFMVPLAIVTAITYFGAGEAAIRKFSARNVFISKLILAAVFFAIAAMMFLM